MTDESNRSAEAIAASQQVGEELPSGIRHNRSAGRDMDDPGQTGALDPDQPGPVNTAAGLSVGGTGAGIEPGVDADLLLRDGQPETLAADVYDEPAADVDWDRASEEAR